MNDQDVADAERHQQELEQMEQDLMSADQFKSLENRLLGKIIGAINVLKIAEETNFGQMRQIAISNLIKFGNEHKQLEETYLKGFWK
jgi:hypothetical protein